jgi:hypothetical protein
VVIAVIEVSDRAGDVGVSDRLDKQRTDEVVRQAMASGS